MEDWNEAQLAAKLDQRRRMAPVNVMPRPDGDPRGA